MTAFTTRPELAGTFGGVASTHWIGSAIGMKVLEAGGNAFDAAVAVAFTLQVVEPHLNGPAGDASILIARGGDREPTVVCGQGGAPAGATLEHFRALGLGQIPGTGSLAPCVPGAFGAWLTLLRDWGTITLRDALAPAIHYAREGHPIHFNAVETIRTVEDLFRTEWTTSAALYLPGDRPPTPGDRFANPRLAQTYIDLSSTPSRPVPSARRRSRRRCRIGTKALSPTRWRHSWTPRMSTTSAGVGIAG